MAYSAARRRQQKPGANAMNDINLYHDELLLIVLLLVVCSGGEINNGKKY